MGRKRSTYTDEYERTMRLIRKHARTRPLLVLLVLEYGIDNVDFTSSAIHVRFFNDEQSTCSPEKPTPYE